MSQVHNFQPVRRGGRIVSGVVGAAIGLGMIVSVVEGMGARSNGQSLGQFWAQQRAIATDPVAQVEPASTVQLARGRRGV